MVRLIKYFWFMVFLFVLSLTCFADDSQNDRWIGAKKGDFKTVEIGFIYGQGTPLFSFKNSFSDSYEAYWYDVSFWTWYFTEYDFYLSYSSSIEGTSEKDFGIGGFINYFFADNLGFQFMLEGSSFAIPVKASHSVDLSLYYYYSGNTSSYTGIPTIEDTMGNLSVRPISFNIITRFFMAANISGYLSGGLTQYQVDIESEAKVGSGVVYNYYDSYYDLQYLWGDSVLIPVIIDETFNVTGGNVGGGIFFQILENFGIVADFRYYLASKEEVSWVPKAGNYDKVLVEEYGWTFVSKTVSITQNDIDNFLDKYGRFLKVEVDPSYYHFSFGLQFRF